MFDIRKPKHLYLPERAIWFWTTEKTKSSVTIVNNQYRYQIFDIVTGKELEGGYHSTLRQAKNSVLTSDLVD